VDLLRTGVIGTGKLGSLHAKVLGDSRIAELTGIFDIDLGKAGQLAQELETRAYGTLHDLLDAVEAVIIAAETTAHFAIAMDALKAGKHVFIEKPITRTVDEAAQLCMIARTKGCILQVGHIERFNAAILALEKFQIDPKFVESHRLAQFNPRGTDVAVVLDLMIHDIDIILSFVHSPVARIDANGVAVISDSVDIANARLQFENGCVANVTASRISQRKMRKMRLFQKSEYISIDFLEGSAEVFRLVANPKEGQAGTMMLGEIGSGKNKRTIVYEQPKVKPVNALEEELRQFISSIQKGTQPVVSGEDGKRALEVANIIMEKIEQQKVQW
jgi:predicted dehydrogenase